MIPFALYDAQGRISQTGAAPDFMVAIQATATLRVVVGEANHELDFVRNDQIVRRPASPVELAGNVLIGLPQPCVIHINRQSYGCNEPIAHLDFPYPGTYQIRVEAFPYLDANFTLEQA